MNSKPTPRGSSRFQRLRAALGIVCVAICATLDALGAPGWLTGIAYILVTASTLPLRKAGWTATVAAIAVACTVVVGVSVDLQGGGPATLLSRGLSLLGLGSIVACGAFRRDPRRGAIPNALTELERDRLTGTATRGVVLQELERRTCPSLLSDSEITLLLVDLDDFDRVNERYGRWVGDRLLRQVSDACTRVVRAGDTVGRVGNEEFAVICPGSDVHGGTLIADRLRESIRGLDLSSFAFEKPVSVSIGVAGWSRASGATTDLLTSADVALCKARYHRKSARNLAHGSNRVY